MATRKPPRQNMRTCDFADMVYLPLRCRWYDDELGLGAFFLRDIDTTSHAIIGDIRRRDSQECGKRFEAVYPIRGFYPTLDSAKAAVESFYRKKTKYHRGP